jgi:molybdenum cofactor cytidylyltransferase
MLLRNALRLERGTIVAAVGAGGKTTLLQRLADELAAEGACVVSTTTTAIWEPEGVLAVENEPSALVPGVARLVRPGQVVVAAAGRRLAADGAGGPQRSKLIGVASSVPALLLAIAGVDYVLVEADGARATAIKAPAEHEPVIPPAATHVLAVVGIEALGEPLGADIAHRPERIAALLGIAAGTPLSPSHIASLLVHPQGGRKGVPDAAHFCPFINKVQDEPSLRAARAIAGFLRGQPGVERVLIGAALAPEPVLEVWA